MAKEVKMEGRSKSVAQKDREKLARAKEAPGPETEYMKREREKRERATQVSEARKQERVDAVNEEKARLDSIAAIASSMEPEAAGNAWVSMAISLKRLADRADKVR